MMCLVGLPNKTSDFLSVFTILFKKTLNKFSTIKAVYLTTINVKFVDSRAQANLMLRTVTAVNTPDFRQHKSCASTHHILANRFADRHSSDVC